MFLPRRPRLLPLALIAGGVPLLLALSLHGQPAPPTPTAAHTPRQVADALDKIVQPRFQDVTAGAFGMMRLVPVASGHQAVGFYDDFRTSTPAEAALLAAADAPRHPYVMAFLHCAHVPGRPGTPPVGLPRSWLSRITSRAFALPLSPEHVQAGMERDSALIQKTATDALPALRKGKPQEKAAGEWLVVMRPVRASTDTCLGCHVGAQRGDTLGVMVYAVRNKAARTASRSFNDGHL